MFGTVNGKSIYFTQISQDEFVSWFGKFTLSLRRDENGFWNSHWCGIRGDPASTKEEALKNFEEIKKIRQTEFALTFPWIESIRLGWRRK